nr:beta-glucuronosyltransferase GlcAT14C [Tanacetum cinerariifolium]
MSTTPKRQPRFKFTSSHYLTILTILSLILFLSLKPIPHPTTPPPPTTTTTLPPPPRFAYFISGTSGDGPRLTRLLNAVYHTRNFYLLHLDIEASEDERNELIRSVNGLENVVVVEKGNLIVSKGITMVASLLQGVAVLLRKWKDWDWFVNLSASDYPLMPQDDTPEGNDPEA